METCSKLLRVAVLDKTWPVLYNRSKSVGDRHCRKDQTLKRCAADHNVQLCKGVTLLACCESWKPTFTAPSQAQLQSRGLAPVGQLRFKAKLHSSMIDGTSRSLDTTILHSHESSGASARSPG